MVLPIDTSSYVPYAKFEKKILEIMDAHEYEPDTQDVLLSAFRVSIQLFLFFCFSQRWISYELVRDRTRNLRYRMIITLTTGVSLINNALYYDLPSGISNKNKHNTRILTLSSIR